MHFVHPSREHLNADGLLHLHRVSGPFSFLNPTRAYYKHLLSQDTKTQDSVDARSHGNSEETISPDDDKRPASNLGFEWRSRDNRKGRHALIISPFSQSSALNLNPKSSSSYHETTRGILKMLTRFPYWDISYLVAITFTCGSIIWVLNAFFVYLPLAQPQTEFKTEILTAGGITAFLGATVFEIGSILLMLEAVNENRTGCFGWVLASLFENHKKHEAEYRLKPDVGICLHHHANTKRLLGKRAGTMLPLVRPESCC